MSVVGDRGPSEEDPGVSQEDIDFSRRARFYPALLALLILLLALQPYAHIAEGLLVQLAFAGLLFAGLAAVASKRRLLVVGLILAVPAIALAFVRGGVPTVAGGVLRIAMLLFICIVILRRMY